MTEFKMEDYFNTARLINPQQVVTDMGCQAPSASIPGVVPPEVDVPAWAKEHRQHPKATIKVEQGSNGREVVTSRGKLKMQVEIGDSFLAHHFNSEVQVSPYASMRKIRMRQVTEHYIFNDITHCKLSGKIETGKLTQIAVKAWFQRTFIDCLQRAQKSYFDGDKTYEEMRKQLVEEYTFELFQCGQFINAGFGKFSDGKCSIEVPLSVFMINSDSALYPLIQSISKNYPLVEERTDLTFPEVESFKANINILDLFPSKCFQDKQNLNIQTTMDDLRFLIDQANKEYQTFKKDMMVMMGDDTLCDCKVKIQNSSSQNSGKTSYNASAVRRVFIKWAQTLIERIPDMYLLPQFVDFISSKRKIGDNFMFKGIVSPTTHQQVIKVLSKLIESVKFELNSDRPREEFGLFLYDMLRCKAKRKTGQQVVELLQNLKSMKTAPSGRRFEVFRLKNRFEWATRDLLINFRYGQHLVGQAQLCVDIPSTSELASKNNKFGHYLYQLERGLFGPTLQMVMQYEDFSRKDITVTLEAEGQLQPRKKEVNPDPVKNAGRKCPHKHNMIALKGDLFCEFKLPNIQFESGSKKEMASMVTCQYCYQKFSLLKEYHYCYYCTIFYCLKCLNKYQNTPAEQIKELCTREDLYTSINSVAEIQKACKDNKAILCVFYKPNRLISRLFVDQITLLLSTYASQGLKIPPMHVLLLNDDLQRKYNIKRVPTALILDKNAQIQLTMVGATFHDIESLIEVRERVANSLKKGLKLKCIDCGEIMKQEKPDVRIEQDSCQVCMDGNKIDQLEDFMRVLKYVYVDFWCLQGHKRCGYCGYLSYEDPSYYRDHTGRTYLSALVAKQENAQCSKGHSMKLIDEPQKYACSRCKLTISSEGSDKINFCTKCSSYLCADCDEDEKVGVVKRFLKEKVGKMEIVSHFMENRSEEAYPCGCGKLFLKTYHSRVIDNSTGDKNLLKQRLMEAKSYFWDCFVCKQKFTQLQLHLGCFHCQYAHKVNGEISHIQICLNCAISSQMIGRTVQTKVDEIDTDFQCSKGHTIKLTSQRKTDSTTQKCIKCKKVSYAYTERFHCPQCKFDCCKDCSLGMLKDKYAKQTKRKYKDTPLKYSRVKPKLAFCSDCKKYLKADHYACQQFNYHLCITCGLKDEENENSPGLPKFPNKLPKLPQMPKLPSLRETESPSKLKP